jgi:DNA-binding CsgD family transcriptional regulator
MANELIIPRHETVWKSVVAGEPLPVAQLDEDQSPNSDLLNLLDELAKAVRAGRYAANARDGVLVDAVVGPARCLLLVHEPSPFIRLSPREREIARMVADGRTNQAIAGALDISVWTVSTHLRRIFAKLAVCSRAEMVAHVLRLPEFSHRSHPADGKKGSRLPSS